MKFKIIITKDFSILEIEHLIDSFLKKKGENTYIDSLDEKMETLKKYLPFMEFELKELGKK